MKLYRELLSKIWRFSNHIDQCFFCLHLKVSSLYVGKLAWEVRSLARNKWEVEIMSDGLERRRCVYNGRKTKQEGKTPNNDKDRDLREELPLSKECNGKRKSPKKNIG